MDTIREISKTQIKEVMIYVHFNIIYMVTLKGKRGVC